jgi:hypothetical protein
MLQLEERPEQLAIRHALGAVTRWVLAGFAMAPLWGAYELFTAVDWATLPGLAHCVIATIGAGAVALSALFHLGAIAGNDTQLVLDRSAGLATWIASSPVKKPARTTQPLARIRGIATGVTEWDGSPTYHLAITLDDGAVVAFGSSPSQANVDDARDRMARFVGV